MREVKKHFYKLFALLMSFALMLGGISPAVYAEKQEQQYSLTMSAKSTHNEFKATPNFFDSVEEVELIHEGTTGKISKSDDNSGVPYGKFVVIGGVLCIHRNMTPVDGDIIVFKNKTETIVKFKCEKDKNTHQKKFVQIANEEPAQPGDSEQPKPNTGEQGGTSGNEVHQGQPQGDRTIKSIKGQVDGNDYYITVDPTTEIAKIDEIHLNKHKMDEVSSKISVFSKNYYKDKDKIYLPRYDLKPGNVLTFKSKGKVIGKFRSGENGIFTEVKAQALSDKDLFKRAKRETMV